MNESYLSKKVTTLKESLKTVRYQIANLKHLYSREQVRCWYLHRNKLIEQLAFHEAMLKAQQDATEHRKQLKRKAA